MKVFTIDQVAEICKVEPRTVEKWFDSGRLKGYRESGSRDRRVLREFLIEFMRKYGMPLGDLDEGESMGKVLVVAQDQVLIENLKRDLEKKSFDIIVAANGCEAGILAERFRPDVVIVDFGIGKPEAIMTCLGLRSDIVIREVILIALLPNDDGRPGFDQLTIDDAFKKPFDSALLAERIRTLVGKKRESE